MIDIDRQLFLLSVSTAGWFSETRALYTEHKQLQVRVRNTFIEIEDETIQAKLGIGCFFDTRMRLEVYTVRGSGPRNYCVQMG
jgi:hypothetical protein